MTLLICNTPVTSLSKAHTCPQKRAHVKNPVTATTHEVRQNSALVWPTFHPRGSTSLGQPTPGPSFFPEQCLNPVDPWAHVSVLSPPPLSITVSVKQVILNFHS